MAAYQVAIVKITDPTPGFKEYVQKSAALLAKHGAEYVIRGPAQAVLEGEYLTGRSVIVSKWPSMEAIDAFYNSDEYQKEIKPLREGSGIYDVASYEEGA